MKIVHALEGMKITKEDKKYSMEIHESFHGLRQFILEAFSLYEVSVKVNQSGIIQINARSIQPLSFFLDKKQNKLTYNLTVLLAHHLKLFIELAEHDKKTLTYLDLDDIVVVDEKTFLFVNYSKLLPLSENNTIKVFEPIDKKVIFPSPEMQKVKELPSVIDSRSVYFSLGLLVVFCLFGEKIAINEKTDFKKLLPLIYYTPLYWFIIRALEIEPCARSLVFM